MCACVCATSRNAKFDVLELDMDPLSTSKGISDISTCTLLLLLYVSKERQTKTNEEYS